MMIPSTSFIDGIANLHVEGDSHLSIRDRHRELEYRYYLLILSIWRTFAEIKTNGYASTINISINAKIK